MSSKKRAARARSRSTWPDEDEAQFLNVDLDILSREPLEPLVESLGEKVFVLYVGRERRSYGAHLEVHAGSDKNPDVLIAAFVRLIRSLPPKARRLWKQARTRDFNIGIRGGLKPHAFELSLKAETVRSVAAVGARIVMTVYAAAAPAQPASAPAAPRAFPSSAGADQGPPIEGTLEAIAEAMPNGFHDALFHSIEVSWPDAVATITGVAWVAEEGPPEVYRPFRLTVEDVCSLALPGTARRRGRAGFMSLALESPVRVDGLPGWPPDRTPPNPPFPEACVYSFFVTEWNDFITLQAGQSRLQWLAPAEHVKGDQESVR